jgi:hypothetical protein
LLFEAVTKKADKEGRRCYLESSKDVPNVAIYQRMGFEMGAEMECRDGGDACMVCLFIFIFSILLFDAGLGLGWDVANIILFLFSCTA